MRDLQKDLEVAQTATRKPWRFKIGKIVSPSGNTVLTAVPKFNVETGEWKAFLDFWDADMDFIITASEGFEEAIQRALAAEERVKELEAQCAAMRKVLELLRDSPDCGRDFCSLIAGDDALVDEALYPDAGRNLLERVKRLETIIRNALPPSDCRGWWCPTCKREVDGVEVTAQEYHEECGTYLGGISTDGWIQQALKALKGGDPS